MGGGALGPVVNTNTNTNTGTSVRFVLGGIPGVQPPGGLIGSGGGAKGGSGMIGSSARGTDRFILREAFGNHRPTYASRYSFLNLPNSRTTPFRRAYNAGDPAGSYNESLFSFLPGSNQLNGQAISMLKIKAGGVHNDGGALFSGNPKYVYDGADYTRYKKLKAMNKTYNDYSFGGANNGSYVALKRTRH